MQCPQPEPTPEEMRAVFHGMQRRMRNYALHHIGKIDARAVTDLKQLDLWEDQAENEPHPEPLGANVELDVLRNLEHPRRVKLSPGPLALYVMEDGKPNRMLLDLPALLFSELTDVRKAVYECLERMLDGDAWLMTPKTKTAFQESRADLLSEEPQKWRTAALKTGDALNDDILIALQGVRQCMEMKPVAQEFLKVLAPRLFHPALSSMDSIELIVANPETQHANMAAIVQAAVDGADSLADACADYFANLGHIPLAPPYTLAEIVARWMDKHSEADAWTEVWQWAHNAVGPIPRYHACTVFVCHPERVPDGKLTDLWFEILFVLRGAGGEKDETGAWALRSELVRHFVCHLEANLSGNDGARIANFACWFAERVATLFPQNKESLEYYRKNWVEQATDKSVAVWMAAFPPIAGHSFLRYMTATASSLWATSLLALMGDKLQTLFPNDQSPETQAAFQGTLVSCLILSLPFVMESPNDPTYAAELSLATTATKWAETRPSETRSSIERLLQSSKLLRTDEGLCEALRNLPEKSLSDQLAVGFSLKATAYLKEEKTTAVWEILSDAAWRRNALGGMEGKALANLIEAFLHLQIQTQEPQARLLPHYLAELCEQTDDPDRRHLLFMSVVHASLACDSVSAVRRLLRGSQRHLYIALTKDIRVRFENLWTYCPPWLQGRLRGMLACLHVV